MKQSYLETAIAQLRTYKLMAERAMEQVDDAGFFATPHKEVNPIAIQVKHMAGNMRSRFTDFLTSDGEKPDRARDGEFELTGAGRVGLMRAWDAGWALVFGAIEPLSDDDLSRVVQVRGVDHSVLEAINRQVAHYAYHVGQIVQLAKWQVGDAWQTLSVPRGQSEQWNRERWGKP